jgi:uncharacterized membrane protein YhfC
MNPVLVFLGAVAFVFTRRQVSRWVMDRWLDGRISDRQAAVIFAISHLGLLLLVAVVAIGSIPSAAPAILLAVTAAGVMVLGLASAATAYMEAHGVKDQLRRDRERLARDVTRPPRP